MGNGAVSKLRKLYQAIYEFLTEKWIETHEEGQISRLHRFAHFWLLVYKSFSRNRCPLRATALAYTTLLALVPLLAIAVSISSSLLQEKGTESTRKLITQFVHNVVPQLQLIPRSPDKPDPEEEVVKKITEFISNIKAKTLGVTGVLGLILVGILLLSNIEDTFNDIWGVTRGRSWMRRIVHYWTTISLGPIILTLLVAHVGNVFLGSTNQIVGTWRYIFQLLPSFVLVSLAFALLYKLMPNTPVYWLAALIGGIVGGSAWLLLNIFNAFNLSRVVSMSAIYGSVLAILPIFLIGLYFSWLIVLFGSQVAYAFQNRISYVQAKKAEAVNQRGREYVALRLMTYLGLRFERGERPPGLLEITQYLGVPSRLVVLVIGPLCEAGLVLEISSDRDTAYAPGRPLEAITCHDILQTFRGAKLELETRDDAARLPVCCEFNRIQEGERALASAVSLKELVGRVTDFQAQKEH